MNSFINKHIFQQVNNAPLVVFRIIFGSIMFLSLIRFWLKGWIEEFFINPKFHFHYYGFEWVPEANNQAIYFIFILSLISSLGIAVGLFYKASTILFFLSYAYLELIDSSLYLNHYYLISLMALILIFLPANQRFSLDAKLGLSQKSCFSKAWTINLIRFQLVILYFYAGIAKIQPEWLLEAQPLKLWLGTHSEMPLFGSFLIQDWTAYFFAWFGCIYDLSIGFFLLFPRTRKWAYFFILAFHFVTGYLFNIGLFPYIMMMLTLVFFESDFHEIILSFLGERKQNVKESIKTKKKWILIPLAIYFAFQVVFPLRHFLHDGNVLWTEQGYRFSWRVKLVAKYGNATFYVEDPNTNRRIEIHNEDFLEPIQEKKMSVKPELILQFAHHLNEVFKDTIIKAGNREFHIVDPRVYAEVYVSFNGRSSVELIDPNYDLAKTNPSDIGTIISNKNYPFDK